MRIQAFKSPKTIATQAIYYRHSPHQKAYIFSCNTLIEAPKMLTMMNHCFSKRPYLSFFKNSKLYRIITLMGLSITTLTGKVFAQEEAPYQKMKKMQAVEARIEELLKDYKKEDLLVVFDIDFTLLLPKEPAFQVCNRIAHKGPLRQLFQELNADQTSMLINCMTAFPCELVDAEAPRVIKNLQQQSIKVIACTASMTGAFSPYERAESMRFEALKKQGIDFSNTFPEHQDLELSCIQGFLQRSPVFYKGILFANGLKNNPCKGEAIIELLNTLAIQPKIVIFIDDKVQYLTDVASALQHHRPHTQFIGIEFTGETEHKPKAVTEAECMQVWQALKEKALSLVKAYTKS